MDRSFKLKRSGGAVHLLGTRGETSIHARALREALDAALACDPRTSGLTLPPEFEIVPTWDGHLRLQLGPVDLISNSQTIRDAWNVAHPDMVRQAELHDVVDLAHLAIRRAAQCSVADTTLRSTFPSWSVLIHPIALALALGHDSDRTRYPLTVRAGSGINPHIWDVDADGMPVHPGHYYTAAADCRLGDDRVLQVTRLGVIAPRTASALTFTSTDTVVASLSIPGQLPEVVLDSLAGRMLGDVFELPPTSYPDVDAAAHRCRITGYESMANGVMLQFAPTDHIPYGDAPNEAISRAMRLAPPHI